ncbi:MAG: tetratricopeptide repeat protein [Candidatus Thorarchaeota archaeon]
MEPIGTVMNFYPFLSQKTREIVESTLKDAEGFDDFVEKLVNLILDQEEANDLSYLTTILAYNSINPVIFNKLRPHLLDDVILKPWSFYLYDGPPDEYEQGVSLAIDKALEHIAEDWVRLFLLIIGAHFYLPRIKRPTFIDEATKLVENQPDLECFSTEIYIRSGWYARGSADIAGAMKLFEKAIKISSHYDDVIGKCDAQVDFARCLMETDAFKALSLLEEAYQTSKSWGANHWASVEARNMGLLHSIVGEYDLAVEFYLEAERITEPSWIDKRTDAIEISRIYCDIDLPNEAFEWTKKIMDWDELTPTIIKQLPISKLDPDPVPDPHLSLAIARTVIQLGQLDGVPQLLSEIYKIVLGRGEDYTLASYNFVSGLFEIAIGNLDAGLQNMSDALSEVKRIPLEFQVNSILLALAKAEVQNLERLERSRLVESSGQWMTQLGIHAREKNYPGIMMQHALLKAKYQEMIGETEAAQLTLRDALTFTDSPGVKTLRKRIQDRLQELETSVDA